MVAKQHDHSRSTKENSIRQKLRTYEAVLALSEGYMPTTDQITAWARYALRASGVLDSRDRRLSTQGRGFVRDVRAWVEAVVELGLSKNVRASDILRGRNQWLTRNNSMTIKFKNSFTTPPMPRFRLERQALRVRQPAL